MPTTRRSATRQRTRTIPGISVSTSSKPTSSRATSYTSSPLSARITKKTLPQRKKNTMVSTRASTRAARSHPAPSASPSASTSASARAHPTFPELVRARVAYSPAPSHGGSSASSAASVASPATVTAGPLSGRHPHWIQWPSQLAASSAATTAQASRASSLGFNAHPRPQQHLHRFERAATADNSDLGHYAALLQGSLRKGRESTGSPV